MTTSVGGAFAVVIGQAVATSAAIAAGVCLVTGLALLWRRRRRAV